MYGIDYHIGGMQL